jgi:lycopene cyclase domain-containing protein
MMFTYTIVNILVITSVLLIMLVWNRSLPKKPLYITVAALLILTVVFDSLIILADIVAYDQGKILGIVIGKAPIEDFAYAVVAAVFVPYLWERLGTHDTGD